MKSKTKYILFSLLIALLIVAGIFHFMKPASKNKIRTIQTHTAKQIKKAQTAPNTSVKKKTAKKVNVTTLPMTMIGDSVTLGAKPTLEKTFTKIAVNAKEGRQFAEGQTVVNQFKAQHQLAKTVIIALGTNGPFSKSSGQSLINTIGKDHLIFWVNTYGTHLSWYQNVNQVIASLVKANSNVQLIDWASYAKDHTSWLYDDGIHINAEGQVAYVNLIKRTLAAKLNG